MKNNSRNQEKHVLIFLHSAKALIIGIVFILISISVGATNYYVSLTGSNSYSGTSAGAAWRTITYSATKAQAGDTVFINSGNYGNENVVISNSGTSGHPIVFMGYNGMPILDGTSYTGKAIYVYGKPYITLKNIRVKRYLYGIWVDNGSHHAIIDGCVVDSCCNTDYTNYGWDGYGILVQRSDYSVIKNCSTTDNSGDNIFLSMTHYCTVQNCQAYSKQTANNQYITDYYIVLAWSSYNTVRDSYVEDIPGSYKGNHGFIIKDNPGSGGTEPHSTGNLFVNCTAKKFEECFSFAHQAYGNIVDSCYADNTGKNNTFNFCLQNRDGANNNTFSNCKMVGTIGVVSVYDGTEGTNPQTQNNTFFVNCIFKGTQSTTIGAFLRNATKTTFKNCTFVNTPYLFRFSLSSSGSDANTGTVLRNCILSGVTTQYDTRSLAAPWGFSGTETGYSDMGDVATTYTDFYNGFAALTGTGNISSDPLFSSTSDFHLKSQYGRWNGSAWVNDATTSPCIDAGDPTDSYANEPSPNGSRINIGAYGNTAEASKSSGSVVILPDLIGSWKFEETSGTTAYDSSTYINNGTINGIPTQTTGSCGMALNFDGIDDYITVPNSTSINAITNKITIMAWVYNTPTGNTHDIMERWLYGTGVNERSYNLYINANGKISFGLSSDGTSTNAKWLTSQDSITGSQWTHIAATSDGSTMKIYINGVLDANTLAAPSSIFVSSGDIHIGSWEYNSGLWTNLFNGAIDEIKLYKQALTLQEIQNEYSSCLPTGIENADNNKIISIYPNPVKSKLNIEYAGTNDAINLEIINSIGQIVYRAIFTGKTIVDTETFVDGIYVLKFKTGESVSFKKFIKK